MFFFGWDMYALIDRCFLVQLCSLGVDVLVYQSIYADGELLASRFAIAVEQRLAVWLAGWFPGLCGM